MISKPISQCYAVYYCDKKYTIIQQFFSKYQLSILANTFYYSEVKLERETKILTVLHTLY